MNAASPRRLFRVRPTVRLRLTLLYGVLFILSGAALLALTNVLARQATGGDMIVLRTPGSEAGSERFIVSAPELDPDLSESVADLFQAQAEEYRRAAAEQREADRRALLVQSGVALGVMSLVSIGLGWVVAGRVLRPLRTITVTARSISANNLNERLALAGPNDEIKELGDTFDGLLGRLEGAFDAQRQFVANASHELRTPLARQRTLMEVALADSESDPAALRAALERALVAEGQQERLIEALLTLARTEAGLAHREPLDLADIARDVLAGAEDDIAARRVEVTARLDHAPVTGERALVERLVANLVDNGWRYNQEGGALRIETGTRAEGTFLEVSNSGPPISPDDIHALFEPFRRLGQARLQTSDGHGLGLSIVKAIAAAHGAEVNVTAQPRGGLLLCVLFPAPTNSR